MRRAPELRAGFACACAKLAQLERDQAAAEHAEDRQHVLSYFEHAEYSAIGLAVDDRAMLDALSEHHIGEGMVREILAELDEAGEVYCTIDAEHYAATSREL